MVKKSLSLILFSLCLLSGFLCSFISAYAYEIPDKSYHMDIVERNLGDLRIAVPVNYAKYISWEDNKIINQSSSQITLYANSLVAGSSATYTIRFPAFDTPNYRISSGYDNVDLVVDDIIFTNLPNINDSDFTIFGQNTLVNMIVCMLAGSIVVLLLKKR